MIADDRREAIAARLAETSGRSLEEMREHARFFKADAFKLDGGALDTAAVDAYTSTFAPLTPADPVRDSVRRTGRAPAGQGPSEIATRRAEVAEAAASRRERLRRAGSR